MSQEDIEIVRQPIAVRAQSRRRLEEHLALRFPRVLAFLARMVWRLPARSRLRQALVRRTVQLGYEAVNRRDYEAAFLVYHPEVELILPSQLGTVGAETGTRGREQRIRYQQEWHAEWGELRFEPEELIELGDARLLLVGRVKGAGLSSGAAFNSEWAALYNISAGRVIRDHVFIDHAKALEAAGLEE